MILTVYLTKPTENIPIRNQKEMNSFIHKTIGKDNPYHDSFSDYSISSIQGGKLIDGVLKFNSNPYIVITSNNEAFINMLVSKFMKKEYEFYGCKFQKLTLNEFTVNKYYDIIHTISPILLKHENRKITIDNEKFSEILYNNCLNKLKYAGIQDNSFKIEIKKQNLKQKIIYVGNTFNICTYGNLIIFGEKNTRKTLYNLGLGNSTGSGFGTIQIL